MATQGGQVVMESEPQQRSGKDKVAFTRFATAGSLRRCCSLVGAGENFVQANLQDLFFSLL